MLPAGRGDLAALHLPGAGAEVVERDLLTVDIQPAYDGHRDLLKLRRGAGTRFTSTGVVYEVLLNPDRFVLGGRVGVN